MKCKKCDTELKESSFFCPNCHHFSLYPLQVIFNSLKGKWHVLFCFLGVCLLAFGAFLPFIEASALGYHESFSLSTMEPIAALMILTLGVTCFALIYQNQLILTRIFGCFCMLGVVLSFLYCKRLFSDLSLYLDFSQIAKVGSGFYMLLFASGLIILSSLANIKLMKRHIDLKSDEESQVKQEDNFERQENMNSTQNEDDSTITLKID